MLNQKVTRDLSIVPFLGQLLGALGGIIKGVESAAELYFWIKQRLTLRKKKQSAELVELHVPVESEKSVAFGCFVRMDRTRSVRKLTSEALEKQSCPSTAELLFGQNHSRCWL